MSKVQAAGAGARVTGAQSHPSASTHRSNHVAPAEVPKGVQFENTYRTEPDVRFPSVPIRNIIIDVLRSNLQGETYAPDTAAIKCKELAEMIKQRVKNLGYRRYKIIALVTIMQNQKTAVTVGSRCVWNDKFDNYADGVFKNESLHATGLVYGLYFE